MDSFLLPFLVLISILAVIGCIYNIRSKNKAGIVIGGLFTLILVGATLHALNIEFQIVERIRDLLI
jgi:hypothetical protein